MRKSAAETRGKSTWQIGACRRCYVSFLMTTHPKRLTDLTDSLGAYFEDPVSTPTHFSRRSSTRDEERDNVSSALRFLPLPTALVILPGKNISTIL